ncbi:MAG: hypothetical protein AAFQ23_00080 [Cyanobacteria bacterium J06623_1]
MLDGLVFVLNVPITRGHYRLQRNSIVMSSFWQDCQFIHSFKR